MTQISSHSQRPTLSMLPPDDALRISLHNEVHARPAARIRLPALIVYVAVLNEGITREQEWQHLSSLPGQASLPLSSLSTNFLRLRFADHTVKWERHTEFTRYSIVQSLPSHAGWGAAEPELMTQFVLPEGWLAGIPGSTVAAIQLVMLKGDITQVDAQMALAQTWFGGRTVLASQLGLGHSWAITELAIGADGFERILVVAPPGNSDARTGRVAHRLLEMETYRLMALRGLPVAKALAPLLSQAETALSEITAGLDSKTTSDQQLLDTMIALAARVERATADHMFRFSATRAYASLVEQRMDELREKVLPGFQPIGAYLRHRLSPAVATLVATEHRLASLSERVSRASALLRTRVDIATESQNQLLLEKLTRGQDLQLRLQSTVEGLSIAAISYYVVSLLLYAGKALKGAGMPMNPEVAAGALIPLVLWAVWRGTRHVRQKMHSP